jgi:hypothetical protein
MNDEYNKNITKMMNMQDFWRRRFWPALRYYPDIRLATDTQEIKLSVTLAGHLRIEVNSAAVTQSCSATHANMLVNRTVK